jgi:hypothetical protein
LAVDLEVMEVSLVYQVDQAVAVEIAILALALELLDKEMMVLAVE